MTRGVATDEMLGHAGGLVVVCDREGTISEVVIDRLNPGPRIGPGMSLAEAVSAASRPKLEMFLAEIVTTGSALDWQMAVVDGSATQQASFFGVRGDDSLTVVAIANSTDWVGLIGQFSAVNSELLTALRAQRQQAAAAERKERDVEALEDLMRLNNELVTLQRELAKKNAELDTALHFSQSILETTPDIIYIYDVGTRCIRYANQSVHALLGYRPEDWVAMGPNVIRMLLGEEGAALFDEQVERLLAMPEGKTIEWESSIRAADGEERWLRRRAVAFDRDPRGQITSVLVVAVDITRQHAIEEQLREMATVDELTGLLNRRGLEAQSARAIAQARRSGATLGVLVADLDDLKLINDEFGHAEGDRAIREAARILRSATRDADYVSRIGGDEFIVLAFDATETGMERLAERIEAAAKDAAREGATGWSVSFSTGFAVAPATDQETLAGLYARADSRMYQAKRSRKRR